MRHILLLVFMLIIFSAISFSQKESKTDSLKYLLTHYKETGQDSLQSTILKKLVDLHKKNNPTEAFAYCQKGIQLGAKSKNHRIIFNWYNRTASLCETMRLYTLSLEYYQKAMDESVKYNTNNNWILINLGNFYFKQQHYQKALEYYQKAKNNFKNQKSKNSQLGVAVALNNIGMVCENTEKLDSVLFYYKQAYTLRQEIQYYLELSHSCLLIGSFFQKTNSLDSALWYYDKGIIYGQKANKKDFLIQIYLKKSQLFTEEKKYKQAIAECNKAEQTVRKENKDRDLALVYLSFSNSYWDAQKYNTSKKYVLKAKHIADSLQDKAYVYEIVKRLIDVHDKLGDIPTAYMYLIEMQAIKKTEEKLEIEQIQHRFEIKQNEKELSLLKKNINKLDIIVKNKTFLTRSIILFLIILLVFLVIIIRKNRKVKILFDRETKKNNGKIALAEILKLSVNNKLSLNDFLQKALESILSIPWLSIETQGAIFIKNKQGELEMLAHKQIGEHRIKHCSIVKPKECICGMAFDENKEYIGKQYRSKFEIDKSEIPYIHMKMPISIGNDVFGLLNLYIKKIELKSTDVDFFRSTCNSLANILKQKQLQSLLKEQASKQDELNQKLFAQSIEVDHQNFELAVAKDQITEQHKHITASIDYAKYIQDALLTRKELINTYFTGDHFIFFRSKETVSGDFYYVNKINDLLIFSVADCTGHGVPGAFMTMLSITYLHGIIRRMEAENPGETLNILRKRIKEIFKTFGNKNQNGLDIAFCTINTKTNILEYAGAYNPLWIMRNNELLEYKATRNPIGFYPKEIPFETTTILLQNNDKIYLFSDGYIDQFSEDNKRKFSKKQFRNLIIEINPLPMAEQKKILSDTLTRWQGNNDQIDDITIMGLEYQFDN